MTGTWASSSRGQPEALCATLGHPRLVSGAMVEAAPALRGVLRSLGRHRLRGVREAREVFTVA